MSCGLETLIVSVGVFHRTSFLFIHYHVGTRYSKVVAIPKIGRVFSYRNHDNRPQRSNQNCCYWSPTPCHARARHLTACSERFWSPVISLSELQEGPHLFELLDQKIVLWLNGDSKPAAVRDRCCHQSASYLRTRLLRATSAVCTTVSYLMGREPASKK
ncbi:Rieske 2Fe-2S domain-containing protein [Leptothermofonsia sp. ETS-13]|uniref:Rieske 2Fe-2S domain-containing protein n=1 Tax=Leptothermofonsia sp. ETS-13 TaxID=3035696 RepID=UPI003BA1FD3F